MRKLAAAVVALLAACAAQQPPVHGETPGRVCRAEALDQFIGRTVNSETGEAVLRATHAATLRWAPPGVMLTMDYRSDRVTVRLNSARQITAINCG